MQKSAHEVVEYFSSLVGIDFTHNPQSPVNKIEAMFKREDIPSHNLNIEYIKRDRTLHEQIINLLTVNETYFYREVNQLKMMDDLLSQKSELSILNAPCSSGEEAYSVLLYLASKNHSLDSVKITGIDINSDVLQKAKEGLYSQRKVTNVPEALLKKYFSKVGSLYKIDSDLIKRCVFKQVNIFSSEFDALGKYDVVFSRNMLIYFDEKRRREAEIKLNARLKDGGTLFLGHADMIENITGMKKESKAGSIRYIKRTSSL
jgi:chemotaxis protein methyltransferase CheR